MSIGVHLRYKSKEGQIKSHEFVDIAEIDMLPYGDDMICGYLDLGNGMYQLRTYSTLI